MQAIIVYESMFGNTEEIAEAVRDGLSARLATHLVEVGSAPTVIGSDVQLLVIGGPTHAFGMSSERTREEARNKSDEPLISSRIGLRDWLEIVHAPSGVMTATFDTKVKWPPTPGSAGHSAAKALHRLGLGHEVRHATFHVRSTQGPLLDGEVERAQRWAEDLAMESTGSGQVHRSR